MIFLRILMLLIAGVAFCGLVVIGIGAIWLAVWVRTKEEDKDE